LAGVALSRAQLSGGDVRASTLRRGLAAANVLDQAGWRNDALRTRVLVAQLALATGAEGTARQQLELARPLGKRGTAADRIELCLARALLRLAEHEPAAAARELE